MGTQDLQLDYDAAADMVKAFADASDQFERSSNVMKLIGDIIQERGFVHSLGNQWADVLRTRMSPGLMRASQLLGALSNDVQKAMNDIQGADSEGAARF